MADALDQADAIECGDVVSIDDVIHRLDEHIEQFAAGDALAESLAFTYYVYFPADYTAIVECCKDVDRPSKVLVAVRSLDYINELAADYLVKLAASYGFDGSAIVASAALCRAIHRNPGEVDIANWGAWPDCLGPHERLLPQDERETVRDARQAFARLTAAVELRRQTVTIHERSEQGEPPTPPQPEAPWVRVTKKELAKHLGICRKTLMKRVRRGEYRAREIDWNVRELEVAPELAQQTRRKGNERE